MLFSYHWLKDYIPNLASPQEIADLLAMHAFEVESVEQKEGDWIFDIKILSHRAHDALNHFGIAREISLLSSKNLIPCKTTTIRKEERGLAPLKIKLQSPKLVPRYAALVLEGVKVRPSPAWLQERLHRVGINSINNIVDVANYVMLDVGQPLHAFDYDAIRNHAMTVRASKQGEKIVTLDDSTLELPRGAIVIEDASGLIDLAGIKGGKTTGISAKTVNVILQAANFDAKTIYRTKRSLHYTTQAADIYGHGIDPTLSLMGLERALYLLKNIGAQGKVVQYIDQYPRKVRPKQILLNLQYVAQLLGVEIPEKEARKILEKVGCKIQRKRMKSGAAALMVLAPTRRLDLAIPEDLIEEIGRVYGYENIAPAAPLAAVAPPASHQQLFYQEIVRDAFKEAGATELYTYSFIGKKDLAALLYSDERARRLVELDNPLSEEYAYLRDTLLVNLLKAVARNQKDVHHMKIFELGKVFCKTFSSHMPFQERRMLGALLTGDEGFYELKGMLNHVFEQLGIENISYELVDPVEEEGSARVFHRKKYAQILVGNVEIGFMGEISQVIAQNLKLRQRVNACSIDLEELSALASEEKEYHPPSKYPASIRDIAILVPAQTPVKQIVDVIERAGQPFMQHIDLFDIYEGQEIGEGRKNVAFHLIYQSKERTLTNKEVDLFHTKIVDALRTISHWEVRT